MTKTIDDMKAELEAEGCVFHSEFDPFSDDNDNPYIEFPDKLMIVWNYDNDCIRDAYNLMQERKELEDLRVLALDFTKIGGKGGGYSFMADLKNKAIRLIEQFNITADESDPDENEVDSSHHYSYLVTGNEQQIDPSIKSIRAIDEGEPDE